MAKLRGKEAEYARENFCRELKARQGAVYGQVYHKDVAQIIGTSPQTAATRMDNPDRITIGELRALNLKLKLDPIVVLENLGYTTKQVKEALGCSVKET